MPNLRNGNKGGFEPGLSRWRDRRSTAELPLSTTNDNFFSSLAAPNSKGSLHSRLEEKTRKHDGLHQGRDTTVHRCPPPRVTFEVVVHEKFILETGNSTN